MKKKNDSLLEWSEPMGSNFIRNKILNKNIIEIGFKEIAIFLLFFLLIFISSISIIKKITFYSISLSILVSVFGSIWGLLLTYSYKILISPSVIMYDSYIRHIRIGDFCNDYYYNEFEFKKIVDYRFFNKIYQYFEVYEHNKLVDIMLFKKKQEDNIEAILKKGAKLRQ